MTIRKSTGAGTIGDGGMKPRRERVLLVEDDDGVRRSIHLLLHGRGYDVRSHSSAVSLLADPGTGDARYLIADYRLLDGDGVTLLSELHARGWKGRAILITAHCTDQLRSAARACGYDLVLEKPLRQHELVAALE